LVDYIRGSVEILMNLKIEEQQDRVKSGKKEKRDKKDKEKIELTKINNLSPSSSIKNL
jgi:hypothetical protein